MKQTTAIPAPRNHALFWVAVIATLFGFLWLFNGVLLPFVLGMAIAYLLDPIVDRMEKRKLPRWAGALLILLAFYAATAMALLFILPPLYREAQQLVTAAPGLFDRLWEAATPYLGWLQERIGNGDMETLKSIILDNVGKTLQVGGGFIARVGAGGQAVAGLFATMALTPLVAFFMMKEWSHITAWIDDLLPRKSHKTIRDLLQQINQKMAGFVRGQISVACALAVLYAVGLALTGVKFGFTIGMAAGLLYIIPYLGTAFGLLAALTSAAFQGISLVLAGKILAVFVVGQIIETYFLTPRLVGSSVGLHPLWILFAVMAGGSLFGVTGMLLAVPVAAIAGVLIGFSINRYKKSPYYTDKKKK